MKKFIVLRGERKGPLGKDTMVGTLNMVPTALIEKYPDAINKVRCINSEGKIKEIEHSLAAQGFGFTAISEEGIDSRAYTYTISNTNTIGRKETDFVVKVTEFAIRLCDMEVKARAEMLSASVVDDVKDKIYRAWGVLTNCFKLSVEEAEQFLGELKMGVALDFLRFKDVDFIENLMVDILPYSLTKLSGSKVTIAEIDKYRAKFLANVLKSKRIK